MIRIGVDFGGTKIEAAALDDEGPVPWRVRAIPRHEAIEVVADLVAEAERQAGASGQRRVGMPGSISPRTGLIRNANSTWLNGRPLPRRPWNACWAVRCAGQRRKLPGPLRSRRWCGRRSGGGVRRHPRHRLRGRRRGRRPAYRGRQPPGRRMGAYPLPWPRVGRTARRCWCGKAGCLELYVSGHRASKRDYRQSRLRNVAGRSRSSPEARRRRAGRARWTPISIGSAAGWPLICDVLDPDVIVLGGGMSNVAELYERVPAVVARHLLRRLRHADPGRRPRRQLRRARRGLAVAGRDRSAAIA